MSMPLRHRSDSNTWWPGRPSLYEPALGEGDRHDRNTQAQPFLEQISSQLAIRLVARRFCDHLLVVQGEPETL